jgi:HK97 family phage portal protein
MSQTASPSLIARALEWALGLPAGPRASLDTIQLEQVYTSEQLNDFFRTGGANGSGVSVTESTALKVAAYFRCLSINSGAIANMAADLIRREGEDRRVPAVGHPLRRVLTVKPNQWQTPVEFKKLMQLWLLQRGNAYARKVTIAGDVVALLPMHPLRVLPEQLDNGRMRYLWSPKNGVSEMLDQRDVMHLRGLSLDGITGVPVLRYMAEALGIAMSAEHAAGRMMRNGTFAGGSVEVPGQMGDDAFARLVEQMRQAQSGVDNTGKWIILEDGAKASPFSLSPQELQFLGVRDFQRYDIATFMGVPPFLIGATEKATSWGSGIEQQGIAFVTYTLLDWVKTWEEAIKRDLLPERDWETHDFRFYTQSLMRGDSKAREAYYRGGLQYGWLNPDEVRALEDMNPRADGQGGVYYDPPNARGGATSGATSAPNSDMETGDEPA